MALKPHIIRLQYIYWWSFVFPLKTSVKKVQIGAETQVMKCQVQTFFVGESSPDMPYNIQL